MGYMYQLLPFSDPLNIFPEWFKLGDIPFFKGRKKRRLQTNNYTKMRSSFAYLNIVSLLYLYTCSTTTTAESPIQRSHGGTLLKQRAPIEESSIDYGSLRTCKHKSVSRHIYTLHTKPSSFHPFLHAYTHLLLSFSIF